jgi:hypothetical protein
MGDYVGEEELGQRRQLVALCEPSSVSKEKMLPTASGVGEETLVFRIVQQWLVGVS